MDVVPAGCTHSRTFAQPGSSLRARACIEGRSNGRFGGPIVVIVLKERPISARPYRDESTSCYWSHIAGPRLSAVLIPATCWQLGNIGEVLGSL